MEYTHGEFAGKTGLYTGDAGAETKVGNATGNVRQQIPVVLGAISATTTACVLVAPCAGTIESCKIVNKTAVAKNTTNYWKVDLINKGTTGTAAITMATKDTKTAAGTALAAYVPWPLTVDTAKNDLDAGETVVLTFTKGGTAASTAETLALLDFKPS